MKLKKSLYRVSCFTPFSLFWLPNPTRFLDEKVTHGRVTICSISRDSAMKFYIFTKVWVKFIHLWHCDKYFINLDSHFREHNNTRLLLENILKHENKDKGNIIFLKLKEGQIINVSSCCSFPYAFNFLILSGNMLFSLK